ncbi:glycosyltransferase family 4 protein [Salinimonas marina]|uniref:Glycosyltransferase family 4 protein n=1 Tax=Salinimonas marina TaxID=2785918 RepID=A0A7S9HCG0_9ALTE|nr:glycosyltransferase family 4 protein [Salinimonas marina]QPG05135.1 glycosyltransferase family 4 protein [Salinimonas marina]
MFNIIVPGIFHYKYYIEYFSEDDNLKKFIYSHKINSNFLDGSGKETNLFLRENFLQFFIKIFGAKYCYRKIFFFDMLWSLSTRFISPCKVNLVLMQGNSNSLIKRLALHGHVVGEAVNIHPTEMLKLLNEDKLFHGIDFFWSETVYRNKLREIQNVDYILAPSMCVKESYIKHGFDKNKIFLIPYGVSFSNTSSVAIPTGSKLKIVVVGQVFPRKGHYYLLKSIQKLSLNLDLDLHFIGLADKQYMDVLSSIGVDFTYHGSLSHSVVLDFISSSDISVLPSIEDGFGMVAMESIQMGVPVIVSKFAGASDIISRYGGGVVYDPLSSNGFETSLQKIISGRFSRDCHDIPTWSDYAIQLKELLKNINEDCH